MRAGLIGAIIRTPEARIWAKVILRAKVDMADPAADRTRCEVARGLGWPIRTRREKTSTYTPLKYPRHRGTRPFALTPHFPPLSNLGKRR